MSFFGIVHKIFHFGAKRSQNSVKLELGKRQKVRPIVELLVALPFFKRLLFDTSGLILFIGALLAVQQRVFGCPSRILVAYGDLSISMLYLVYYVIYQKIKTVKMRFCD